MMTDARSRDFRPVDLPVKLQAHMVSKVRPFESNNVIAMLPGSDSQNSKTKRFCTRAHYDHLGIRPDMPGDNIYNGSDDNATGCGILLEMALMRLGTAVAQVPRRSILFASVTAEEQGLLGSEYLGKHPPIAAGKIALDLNYDDLPPLGSSGRSGSFGKRTHHFLSHGTGAGPGISFDDSSRFSSRSRTLLPLRSFQPGPCGHSRVFYQRRREVQGTRCRVGHPAGQRVHRKALSPAQR